MSNRKIFIGCSRESFDIATYLKTELVSKFTALDIEIWDSKNNWRNAKSTLDSLVAITEEFYYSIFIFHPDDFIRIRSDEYWITRDNVIFEAGMFFTKFGGERTFILYPYKLNGHPKSNEFRIPTDINNIEFSNYKIDYDTSNSKWVFDSTDSYTKTNIAKLLEDIQKGEDALNLKGSNPSTEIKRLLGRLDDDLEKKGENDEFYFSHFWSNFEKLIRFKSRQISREIKDVLIDIVIAVNKVDDVMDISQLAEEQSISFNPNLETVWVFSDEPLEFRAVTSRDPLKRHFDKLRTTIVNNLSNNVKYVYFVNNDFDLSKLSSLVGTQHNLLSNVEIVKCDKKHFLTFFTLHFEKHQQNPSEIYVSFIDKKRDDLLIKIPNSNQVKDIHDNLCSIKGKSEITTTYNVFDRTN